jgi:cytochrome P450
LAVNQSPEIWGADAEQYNPERYFLEKTISDTKIIPGIWGNLLTFLGGTRNCIGYRFALAEIRAILFVLIRNFKFEELPSKPEIEKKAK